MWSHLMFIQHDLCLFNACCACVLQPTRTVCQIWCSPWKASGWWARAMTRAWAGCAPRVAACWGDTTSPPGPPAYSILHSLTLCTVYITVSISWVVTSIALTPWLPAQIRSRDAACLRRRLLRTDHAAEAGEADVLHHHYTEGSWR